MADIPTINQSELNRLAQELFDLRRALAPFAEYARGLPPVVPEQHRFTDDGAALTASVMRKDYVITFAHLRHALHLLTRLEAEDEARILRNTEARMVGPHPVVTCAGCGVEMMRESLGAATDCPYCKHPLSKGTS